MKDKEMDVIRNTEIKTKIIELGIILKAAAVKFIEILKCIREDFRDFIHYLETDTTAECTLPIDTDELEIFVRCIWSDIRTFFSKEENIQNCRQLRPEKTESAHLTEELALSDNKVAENLQPNKGGTKI